MYLFSDGSISRSSYFYVNIRWKRDNGNYFLWEKDNCINIFMPIDPFDVTFTFSSKYYIIRNSELK